MNFAAQYIIRNTLEKQFKIFAPMFKSIVALPVYNPLLVCEHFNYAVKFRSLPPSNNSIVYLEHVKLAVYSNTKITDNSQNWVELCFLESLHIKWKKSKLNCGIKATKDLALFSRYH